MKFEKVDSIKNVFQYGDVGDKFFIIVKGLVSIKIKNPSIKDWNDEWRRYNNLLNWKNEYFEPLVMRPSGSSTIKM